MNTDEDRSIRDHFLSVGGVLSTLQPQTDQLCVVIILVSAISGSEVRPGLIHKSPGSHHDSILSMWLKAGD